ncbi:MAG: EpsI family protein [Betaproteobacteria bacterium]|nr:EpsI family protein [Betaproteobacteria bacterium]
MTPFARRATLLAVLMLGASVLSVALTPTRYIAVETTRPDLEIIIPRQFGDWQMDDQIVQAVVNPQKQAFIDLVYSQTLSRTYVNSKGRRIMLSLAYGKNQSDSSRMHIPEVCYPAQGFQIINKWKDVVSVDSMKIPAMRITTQLGNRHEPVTYWMRVGNSVVRGMVEQSFARIGYGLTGDIPDGILFRTSEINPETQNSFILQDQFIRTLLSSLAPIDRQVLVGSIASKNDSNVK